MISYKDPVSLTTQFIMEQGLFSSDEDFLKQLASFFAARGIDAHLIKSKGFVLMLQKGTREATQVNIPQPTGSVGDVLDGLRKNIAKG